jgi:hypothetical protein
MGWAWDVVVDVALMGGGSAGFTLFTITCYLSEMQQMAILFSCGPEAVPGASLSAAEDEAVGYSSVRLLGSGDGGPAGIRAGREAIISARSRASSRLARLSWAWVWRMRMSSSRPAVRLGWRVHSRIG